MKPSPALFDQRVPVWHALSDLFVDTELTDRDYDFIARRLRDARLPAAEIERILVEEVGPAFLFNMVDVAGNWTGWPEESVRKVMKDFFAKGPIVPTNRGTLDRIVSETWPHLVHRLAG